MRKKFSISLSVLILCGFILGACSPEAQGTPPATGTAAPQVQATGTQAPTPGPTYNQTLTVMTHDAFAVSENVVAAFQNENKVNVKFIKSGDTGTAVNKAILSKDAPFADVFYGLDNTFLSRALDEGIFEAYKSPVLDQIPDQFKLDPQNRALPVDYGDVCLNYEKAYFDQNNLQPPQNLEDLSKSEYKDLLVVENPATSSPGLAFLLATIGHFGEDHYLDYWKSLVANNVLVVNDWDSAYYTEFSLNGGSHPIVVSYASSPPAEVVFAQQPLKEAPTAAVTGGDSCFRQIEFVGILKGTKNRDLAEKWVDFMLSTTFQEDIPLQMFVFPVNKNAKLPDVFVKYAAIPEHTAEVGPQAIAENRDKWIQEWTDTVLR